MTNATEKTSHWETTCQKIVEKENRTFSVYPPLVVKANSVSSRVNDIWLELSHFIIEDLRWLLALDNEQFLAYIFYSEPAYLLIASVLRESPPGHLRIFFEIDKNMEEALAEIDKLAFLILARMATDALNENVYETTCDSIVCTLPAMLDFVLLFGTSNPTLVKEIILKIDAGISPILSSDAPQLIFDFFRYLKLLTEGFCDDSALMTTVSSKWNETNVQHVIMYLHDAVATVQILLDLFPNLCLHLCKNENMIELVKFYSKVLPPLEKILDESALLASQSTQILVFINRIRIDLLKIARAAFLHSFSKGRIQEDPKEKSQLVEECLTIMMDLASEPDFIQDYGTMFPAVAEVSVLADSGPDVDSVKAEHILRCLALSGCGPSEFRISVSPDRDPGTDPLFPLIAAIQDVLPHLSETQALEWLKRHECDVERTIAAILDGAERPQDPLTSETTKRGPPKKKAHRASFWFRDDEAVDKSRYAKWLLVPDDTYDDEYDDTYDDDDVGSVGGDVDGVHVDRRPFVVPRVLRSLVKSEKGGEERGNDDDVDDDIVDVEEEEEEEEECIANSGRDGKKGRRNACERPGQGQNKQILRERCHKTVHKNRIGNHNRRKEADRKRSRGSVLF